MAIPVITNPIMVQHVSFKFQEQEIMLASHNLEIEGIYPWGRHANESLYESVKKYCASHRIDFGLREFNSEAFIQDRECITRLPAFHIYYKEEYAKSFYCGDNPSIFIQEILVEERKYKREAKRPWYWWVFKKKTYSSSSS
jgi:hypothetical protein